jgi:putative flippase GtrA
MTKRAFKLLNLSFAKYLFFGGFQFAFDFVLFFFLQNIGLAAVFANVTSRFSAALAGYYLNKRFTFGVGEVKTYSMFKRYWLFWLFMTGLSSTLVFLWDFHLQTTWSMGIGKFTIECFLCILGYLISRFWVYKHDSK